MFRVLLLGVELSDECPRVAVPAAGSLFFQAFYGAAER